MKSFERHIKSSHAVGKFIVDGVVGRAWSTLTSFGKKYDDGAIIKEDPHQAWVPDNSGAQTAVIGLPLGEADFALLTSAEVVDLISRSTDSQVEAIGEYERGHRRRRLVLEAVNARASQ